MKKGTHRMPDGSMMMDSAMKMPMKKPAKKGGKSGKKGY